MRPERFVVQALSHPELALLTLDSSGTILALSAAGRMAMGAEPGTALSSRVHPADRDRLAAAMANRAVVQATVRIGEAGAWRLFLFLACRLEGAASAWLVHLFDLTRMHDGQQRYEALVAAGDRLTWSRWGGYDPASRTVAMSPRTYGLVFGEEVHEERRVTLTRLFGAVHPDDRGFCRSVTVAALARKQPFQVECRVVHADGTVRWMHALAAPMRDLDDRTALVGYVADVTLDHLHADQLARTRHLEALRVLAGGVAHDFNNKLTAIRGYLRLARASLGPTDDADEFLALGLQAAGEAGELAQRLMALARSTPLRVEAVPLRPLFETAAVRGASRRVQLDSSGLKDDLWPALGDPVALREIADNLVGNAIEAIEASGTIRVSGQNLREPDGRAMVELVVEDDGPGIGPEAREGVFQPYVSTKAGGHGLGLATVHAIVRQHGGTIRYEPVDPHGARFRIRLPAP